MSNTICPCPACVTNRQIDAAAQARVQDDEICFTCEAIAMIEDEGEPHTCGLEDTSSWEEMINRFFCDLVENRYFEQLPTAHQDGFLLEIAQRCIQWSLEMDTK